MIKLILCLVCGLWLFTGNVVVGQNQKVVDSLTQLLKHKTGGERYAPLYELTFQYIDVDNQKALEIIDQAVKAALVAGDSLCIVKSMRVKGQILSRLEEIQASIDIGETALAIASRHGFKSELAMIINNLATSFSFIGEEDKALQYFFNTIELASQNQDTLLFSNGLHNIGIIYYRLDNYEKALSYLLRALKIDEFKNNVRSYQLKNISLCYANLNDFNNADFYVKKSLIACGPNCHKNDLMAIRYTNGFISYQRKDYQQAERELLIANQLAKEVESVRFQFDIIHLLTEIYLRQNRIEKAQFLLNEADQIILEGCTFNLEMLGIYTRFYQLHTFLGNLDKIAFYQRKYINLRDSIYDNRLTTKLMKIESDFEQRENVKEIAKQKEVLMLKDEVIINRGRLNLLIGALAVILIILIMALGRSVHQKKLLNQILDEKVIKRTKELNKTIGNLSMDIRFQNLLQERSVNDIKSYVATIKGLGLIGLREIHESKARFFIDEMCSISQRITESLELMVDKNVEMEKVTSETALSSVENRDKSTLA